MSLQSDPVTLDLKSPKPESPDHFGHSKSCLITLPTLKPELPDHSGDSKSRVAGSLWQLKKMANHGDCPLIEKHPNITDATLKQSLIHCL